MSKEFRGLMTAQRKAHRVEEFVTCGGEFPTMLRDAIAEDWQHALMQAHTEAVEHMRFLSHPDEGDFHRLCLKKDLASLAAVAEAMAENLRNL